MHLLDLTLPTLEENLALDEALLLTAEEGVGPEVLRFWEWPRLAVVLGAACSVSREVCEPACRSDGVQLGRRASGGGTVLLGPGCLCYSLILAMHHASELQSIRTSWKFILERIRDCFDSGGTQVEFAGTSDLAYLGRKFSGNAQQRKRRFILHHGTLLYAFDLEKVRLYLPMPSRQPAYRQDRGHAEFLCNLGLERAEIVQRLQKAWDAWQICNVWPGRSTEELVQFKYSREDWVFRR